MPRRLTQLVFIILAAAGATPSVVSQSASAPPPSAAPRAAERETFRQLLYLPAPTPRTTQPEEENGDKTERPPGFYDDDKTPPDDAPAADLLDYWERRAGAAGRDPRKPSEAVRRRLMDACEADPERLPRLLPYLPDTQETADRVKKLYDAAQGSGRFDGEWRKSVREWLQFNSRHFLSELTGAARKAGDKGGYVEKEEALRALARVDWEAAEPLLQEGNRGLQPAGRPDEFWAAVPDRGKNETRVGRYSTKYFTFRTLLVVPRITFDSFQMWVDAAGAKLYVVYEGQLLRLPIPKEP